METTHFLRRAGLVAAAALATGAFLAIAASLLVRTAQALPVYAQQTGLPCGRCHVNPHGGGPRTVFGRAFAANGHRVPGAGGHRYGYFAAPRYGNPGGMVGGGRMMGGGMTGEGMMGQPLPNQ